MKTAFIFFILFITTVNAQSDTLTLKTALNLGLQISNEINMANSDTIIADAYVTNAWSNLLPKLTLGANYNHLSEMPLQFNFPFPVSANNGAMDVLYMNATIEQPLFTGLRLWSLKNAAEYNKKAKLLENKKTLQYKAIEIETAYWNYYKSLKVLDVLNDNLEKMELQRKTISNFLKIGMATKNDLLKIMVAVSDVKSKIIDAKNASLIARANFNRVVGLDINNNSFIKTAEITIDDETFDYDSLLTEALSTRFEIKANSYRIKAADANITAAKSTWFPQISANASYNYLKFDGDGLLSNDAANFWWIGIGAQWNIWDWWKTSSNATIAEQKHFQVDLANKMLKDRIEIEVYKNYLDVQSKAEKINLHKLEVQSAEENYNIINNKFNSQMATPTEVSDASFILSSAKIKLINSLVDYKIAKLKLENSIGRKIY